MILEGHSAKHPIPFELMPASMPYLHHLTHTPTTPTVTSIGDFADLRRSECDICPLNCQRPKSFLNMFICLLQQETSGAVQVNTVCS